LDQQRFLAEVMSRPLLRVFDVLLSGTGILLLSPVMFFTALCILVFDGPPVLYVQQRVGRYGVDFRLFKFRTMRRNADTLGQLTVGGRDPRITRTGHFLRRYKLDELPQLFNVLTGSMSMVGPRPEVRRYVERYTPEQRKVLEVRPGITDEASIVYSDENHLLGGQSDPEKFYLEVVMPDKIRLNMRFIDQGGPGTYFGIIFRTLLKVLRG
jgi:lipopolysaccharide/colanic/teichoic acid biosynthesis glycosyltransferase